MLRLTLTLTFVLTGGLLLALTLTASAAQRDEPSDLNRLLQIYRDGNYAEAYDGLRKRALAKDTASTEMSRIIETAIASLQQLNRVSEIDEFREQAGAAHP